MKDTPLVDYCWMRPCFPEMLDAVADGFYHTFSKTTTGMYRCLSYPDRLYSLDECAEKIVRSKHESVTLYLITTKDGIKGIYHQYHQHY